MYWCDKCEDTTPAWYQANRKPLCCICKEPVIESGEYIRALKAEAVKLHAIRTKFTWLASWLNQGEPK